VLADELWHRQAVLPQGLVTKPKAFLGCGVCRAHSPEYFTQRRYKSPQTIKRQRLSVGGHRLSRSLCRRMNLNPNALPIRVLLREPFRGDKELPVVFLNQRVLRLLPGLAFDHDAVPFA